MQDAFLLPTAVYVIGLLAVLAYERPRHEGYGARPPAQQSPVARPAPVRAESRRSPCNAGPYLIVWPVEDRLAQASTTRAAMPASAALPQARGS